MIVEEVNQLLARLMEKESDLSTQLRDLRRQQSQTKSLMAKLSSFSVVELDAVDQVIQLLRRTT